MSLATLVEETDLGGELIPYQGAAELSAIEAMTRAEIDTSIATAKRYPRSVTRSTANAKTLALSTPAIAESCFYTLPARKGKDENGQPFKPIIGPSVRLAEILASTWGNIRVVVRITQEAEKYIIVQAIAQDMETNNTKASEIRRSIWGRHGRYSESMISQTANAACSIAYRNVVNAVIPKALWNEIYIGCRRLAAGQGKSIEQGRENVLAWIKEIQVTPAELYRFLAVEGIADVTLSHMELLAGIRTSLAENMATVEEVFRPAEPSPAEQKAVTTLQEKLKARREPKAKGPIQERHQPVAEVVADLKAAEAAKPARDPGDDDDLAANDEAMDAIAGQENGLGDGG